MRSCHGAVGGFSTFYEAVFQAIADRYEIDLATPWQDLTDRQRRTLLHGTGNEKLYVQVTATGWVAGAPT